jgi:hypothetical protein
VSFELVVELLLGKSHRLAVYYALQESTGLSGTSLLSKADAKRII